MYSDTLTGIGRALLAHYLSQPNNIVVAGVRDLKHQTTLSLSNLPLGAGSKLITVKIDSVSDTDAAAAISTLQSEYNVSVLDVVVANSGICRWAPIAEVPISELVEHLNVNAIGPVRLFQATRPLLQRSTKNPRFAVISSVAGSVAEAPAFELYFGAYGASKATINFLTRKIHFENEWLTALPLHPG